MKLDSVSVQKSGGVALVILETLSLTRQLGFDLAKTVNALTHDADVRVLVIMGRRNVFLSGVDLKEIRRLESAAAAAKILEIPRITIRNLISCPKPVIGAINGFCLGAGAELALACDLRVSVDRTQNMAGEEVPFIGFLHAQRGMVPHIGGSQLLPRLVGPARAKELLMSGKTVDGAEAFRIGLVDRVTSRDLLLETTMDLAHSIARNDGEALRMVKELVHRSFTLESVTQGLALERDAFSHCWDSSNHRPRFRRRAELGE